MTLTTVAPDASELPSDLPPDDAAPQDRKPGAALTCLSAFLATAAFGWIAGSVFSGPLARLVGLAGAALGVGVVALSTRSRRPSVIQYGGAAVAVVLGALLVLPDATGGGASLPSLVAEALRSGGLGMPPVAFDPGWRFLLFVLCALLGQTTAGLALGVDRPRLAALVALPLVVGAALLQPPGEELVGTVVALLLLVGALAVSLGADLAGDGSASGAFELRRLARGAGALVVLGGLLAGTAQVGFLVPATSSDQTVPPMRPQLPPPAPDRVLFTVQSERPVTWRLGTLDVYRDPAWLTPPFDTGRLVPVKGPVPAAAPEETRGALAAGPTFEATFTLADNPGKALPSLANVVAVSSRTDIDYDPRTQSLRVQGTRPRKGTTYTVRAPVPPTGAQLAAATPPGAAQQEFLRVPAPPVAVTQLLGNAPENPFARLQYVRRAYFAKVIAAGAGKPVDVSPTRVGELLAGKPGTPYEISAGEVLLARWAGVPARIGYGYFGGKDRGTTVEVRPRHGATWLEAWFGGYGWVPIVGTPPRAKVTLNKDQQNGDPSIRASNELALVTYVPVRLQTVRLVYELVRFYAVAALPWVVGGGLLLLLLPALVKAARRSARGRAARRLGRQARIAAAYAELRDAATDLAIGHPAMTPVEFADAVAPDQEHRELAWLVTRALWGDLARDLQDADVEAAETMARSVAKRLRVAQPGFSRAAALAGRASLAQPWTRELPALWPERRGVLWPPRPLPTALVLLVALAAGLALPALRGDGSRPPSGPALPARVAPAALGDVRFVPELEAQKAYAAAGSTSLATEGRVFSLRQGDVVQGSLQVAGLVGDVDVRNRRVREQVLEGLGSGKFVPARIGEERVYRIRLPEQTLLLSFADNGRSFTLMVTRAGYRDPERVFAAVLAYRRGQTPSLLGPADVPVPDPRRGSPS
jgi:hypothetical protein